MRDRGVALGNAANPGFSSQTSGLYGSGAAEARGIARDPARGGIQEYDDALTQQAQARTQNLDPLQQGPLGQIAGGGDGRGTLNGTQAVADAILPAVPLTGGQGELADATRRIGALDPEGIAQLVRQRFADQYEHSATGLVGGPAQGGGAKFAKDMAGDRASQKQANIDAVLGALPNSPQAVDSVDRTLDALRVTGRRLPAGSNTAADRAVQQNLSEPSMLGEAATAGRSLGAAALLIGRGVRDKAQQVQLGRQTGRLADLFTAPDSAAQIAAIAERGVEPVLRNALSRFFVQSPGALNAR
ncbi:hypothetical protein [Methylobacterium sp. WL9]|uniref:hypothetical protein n=1 Tax=Methylobacterium sp. WL9 TaxID=2603898 RepID=UPI00164FA48E|nr:hypothetical protein [Methylobacterium sp. WL9]